MGLELGETLCCWRFVSIEEREMMGDLPFDIMGMLENDRLRVGSNSLQHIEEEERRERAEGSGSLCFTFEAFY